MLFGLISVLLVLLVIILGMFLICVVMVVMFVVIVLSRVIGSFLKCELSVKMLNVGSSVNMLLCDLGNRVCLVMLSLFVSDCRLFLSGLVLMSMSMILCLWLGSVVMVCSRVVWFFLVVKLLIVLIMRVSWLMLSLDWVVVCVVLLCMMSCGLVLCMIILIGIDDWIDFVMLLDMVMVWVFCWYVVVLVYWVGGW